MKPPHNERLRIEQGENRRAYGRFLTEQHRFRDAEQELLESLQLLQATYAAGTHPNVLETRRALMELYRALGNPDLVERHRVPPGEYFPY